MKIYTMRHKSRLISAGIVAILLLISVVLFKGISEDLSSEKGSRRRPKFINRVVSNLQPDLADKIGSRRAADFVDPLENQEEDGVDDRVKADTGRLNPVLADKTTMSDQTIDRLLSILDKDQSFSFDLSAMKQLDFKSLTTLGMKTRQAAQKLAFFQPKNIPNDAPNWVKFHSNIRQYSMYDPSEKYVDGLLKDMAKLPFKTIEMMEKGTELKLLVQLRDGGLAVFKPKRWPRDHETLPNHYYFNDYERHNAEIAAFHLDRVLGFYRVPPVTGRLVNMTREIFQMAERKLKQTFYVSPIGNLCFYGECTYYCDSRHSFCGEGDIIEGSLMAFLPPDTDVKRKKWKSPYRRSYSKFRKAEWEKDDSYCNGVKEKSPYDEGRLLIDIVDMHIFDFITGNMDRHHVELFEEYQNYSNLVHLDNGRGFGKTKVDEFSIITPLRQCCMVRESTFLKLAKLYIGPQRLSELMDESTKKDPIYPILTTGHLNALDRRVIHILRIIAKCVDQNGVKNVILKDKF